MTGPVPVSAVLITLNADEQLERVLRPLRACSEIVVLDSGSVDRTRQIAVAAGARWFTHPFDGYGPQKRRAVALARQDWVLSIDADEELDQDGVAAIRAIDWPRQDPRTCWRIRRRPFIGAREIRHGHWVPDLPVRLFHRCHHDFSDEIVHEGVRPSGTVRILSGSLLHRSYRDLAELFRADYHRLKAARERGRGRRASGPRLALRATAVFVRSYLLRRGFLDGPAGVAVALAGAVGAVAGLAMASDPAVAGFEGSSRRLDGGSELP